ncbi:tetratricopeptide repeat protein [Kribbella sp. NPDC056345]|uniref:tetratricopeptide repeat protein n=1 Tax=Kribbella sp. NPDC056345 TaxID=3345789 RepID=UPI0035DB97C8
MGAPGEPPGPGGVRTLDELSSRLRSLQTWSGLSYRELHRRVVLSRQARGVAELPAFNTVYRCLAPGRRRLDAELVVDIARALLADESRAADEARVAEWRQAYQVVAGLAAEAAVVRIEDSVEPETDGLFVGRSETLDAALTALDDRTAGRRMLLIEGMPGVGKTTLARRLVRRLPAAELQLGVNLRGYDPDRPPADPAAVLEGFLRRLGVPGSRIHGLDLAARSALFRELTGDRKVVVLLDNAASDDQLEPLLADGPGCVTVVTSRRRLTGAQRICLEVFDPEESLAYLRQAAGAVVDDDRTSAIRIAELVGHLPLALAVLAGRIKSQPGWTLADHLERLLEHRARLRLDSGVAASLDLSYQALPIPAARMLRLLALHPGRDFDVHAGAALAEVPLSEAVELMTLLVQMHLLDNSTADRYELHDLVRVLATDQAHDEDPPSVRRTALDGLYAYYQRTAASAAVAYAPHDRERIELTQQAGRSPRHFCDRDEGRGWLDAERHNLIASALYAADHGRGDYAVALSSLLIYYFQTASLFSGAETLHLTAIRCATDDRERGRAYNYLGTVYWRLGRYADGRAAYQEALEFARRAGNRVGEASGLSNVALGHYRLGDYLAALDCQRQAQELFEAESNLNGATTALGGQGWALLRLDRPEEALERFELGLELSRKLGTETFEESFALVNVASAHEALGRLTEAEAGYRHAHSLAQRIGFANAESDSLNGLGRLHRAAGRAEQAIEFHQQALDLADRLGSRSVVIEVRNDYGHALRAAGRTAEAIEQHSIALQDAKNIDDRYEQERASAALAAIDG